MSQRLSRFLTVEWLLVFGAVWLSFDVFMLGPYGYVGSGEYGEMFVPSMLAHQPWWLAPPDWNVFTAAGFDRAASGWFGWLNVVAFAALPGWLAIQALTLVKIIAAVVGTYVLALRVLGLTKLAAAFAALLFTYSHTTPMITHSVIAYMPLTILALTLVFDDGRDWKGWVLLCASGLVLATTNHLPFVMPFPFLILVIWFALVDPRWTVGTWLLVGLFSGFLVLLRLPDYVAVGFYGGISGRHGMDPTFAYSVMLQLEERIVLLFFGRPPLIFASLFMAFGLAVYRLRTKGLSRLIFALIAGWGLFVAMMIVKPLAVEFFPVLRTFSLGRFVRYLEMFLPMAAGFGVMALQDWAATVSDDDRQTAGNRVRRAASALALVALFLLALEHKYTRVRDWVGQGGYTLLFRSPVLSRLADDIRAEGEPARVASFQMYTNYPNAYGIETAGGYQALNIKRYQEFWRKVQEPGRQMVPSAISDGDFGRLALNPREHRAEWNLAPVYDLELLSLLNVRYVLSRDRLVAPGLTERTGPATPWSALSVRQKIETNLSANFTGRTHLYVYENRNAMPRFFLADRLRVLDDGVRVLAALAGADLDTLRRTVFVERAMLPPGLNDDTPLFSGTIRLDRYEADRVKLSVTSSGASGRVAPNRFTPYWRARVNGVAAPVFPADHAFWGLFLPSESSTVEFFYDPPYRFY